MNYSKFFRLLLLAAIIFPAFTLAQLVTYRKGKFGLLYKSGDVFLEQKYDSIYPVTLNGVQEKVYLALINKKYGLVNFCDSTFVQADFDEVKLEKRGYLLLRKGNLWGFMSEPSKGKFKLIEPKYKKIYPVGEWNGVTAAAGSPPNVFGAQLDSMHGIISYASGKTEAPFKFKAPVSRNIAENYYYYKDNTGSGITVLNDSATQEFYFPYEVEVKVYKGMLFGNSKYRDNGLLKIYDYHTGKLIFEVEGQVQNMTWNMITDTVIQVIENVTEGRAFVTQRKHINWFNIHTSKMLLFHNGIPGDEIHIDKSRKPYIVYLTNSERYNSSPKEIGTWDGKKIKWKGKAYLPDKN